MFNSECDSWENFRYKKGGRFRSGDLVRLSFAEAKQSSYFKRRLAGIRAYEMGWLKRGADGKIGTMDFLRLMYAKLPPITFQVVLTQYDPQLKCWVVHFVSEEGDAYCVEEDFLSISSGHLRETLNHVRDGKTAKDFLGRS